MRTSLSSHRTSLSSRLLGASTARRLYTVARDSAIVAGVGLHGGQHARVRLRPAVAGEGIHFVRTDLPTAPVIAARPSAVVSTALSTTIGDASSGVTVATVEHLMAALCGARVSACRVEVDAPELPVLDGSAAQWVHAIDAAGVSRLAASSAGAANGNDVISLAAPVRVQEGESWAVAFPSSSLRYSVGIDFASHAPIGRQWASWAPKPDSPSGPGKLDAAGAAVAATRGGVGSFEVEVAPARTFALQEQLSALHAAGLIKGGSLENALVCDAERWLNGPLRFVNEPARHKLLDLIGDLALLGSCLPRAHIVAYRPSHRLNIRLAQAILKTSQL